MKKDSVMQIVCFVTDLRPEAFLPKWEYYTQKLAPSKCEAHLHEFSGTSKPRYRYVSMHEWPERDFQFSFIQRKHSEHFADVPVRVIQAGGFILQESVKKGTKHQDDVKLISFVSHDERDLDFYKELPLYHNLHIYQAYYESCLYGNVLEFSIAPENVNELLSLMQKRNTVDSAVYQNSLVAHA